MRYVYLEGIFLGSADIKTMLVNEFNKFKQIDVDFVRLMNKVKQSPVAMTVIDIPDI